MTQTPDDFEYYYTMLLYNIAGFVNGISGRSHAPEREVDRQLLVTSAGYNYDALYHVATRAWIGEGNNPELREKTHWWSNLFNYDDRYQDYVKQCKRYAKA